MAPVQSLHPTKWSVYNPWLYKMVVPVPCFDPQIYWQVCQKCSNQCIHDLIKHIKIPEPFSRVKAGRTAPRCSKQLVFLSRWCLSQSHGHKFEWILMYNMLAYTWQVVTGIGSVSWHPSTAESRSDLADFQWNTSTTTLFTWRVATFNS